MAANDMAKDAFDLLLNKTKSLVELPKHFTKGEIGILFYLEYVEDNVTPGKLCEILNVTTPRIASALNSLENKKFITRKSSDKDKRKIIVSITEDGKNKVNEEKSKIIDVMTEIIEKFGEEKTIEYLKLTSELEVIIKDINIEL